MKKIQRLLLTLEHFYESLTIYNVSVCLLLLIPILVWFIRRRHLPPGPFGIPFFGNIYPDGNSTEFVKKLLRLQRSYGNVFRINLGNIGTVVVLGHDMIREALVVKGEAFKFRPNWLYGVKKTKQENGITWNNGPKWQKLTSLSEMFATRYVTRKGIIDSKISEDIQRMANDLLVNKGRPINVRGMISMTVFNILCDATLGERLDSGTSTGENLSLLIERLSKISVTDLPENFYPLTRMIYSGRNLTQVKESLKNAKTLLEENVKKHKDMRTLSTIRDICDVFLKTSGDKEAEKLSDDNVMQSLVDILVAGYEPTTSTLLWAFLFMVRYPDVQHQCRHEIKQAIAPGRPVTWNDKDKLPYTTATINEVLRLSNTVPLGIPHVTVEDTELGKYKIPRNNMVIFHLYSSHMDPTYWKRPQEFRPEHFLDLDGKLIQHDAFFPYGLGIRACPFFNLAERIIFLIFSNMIRKFLFEKQEGQPAPSLENETGNVVFPRAYYLCPRPLD